MEGVAVTRNCGFPMTTVAAVAGAGVGTMSTNTGGGIMAKTMTRIGIATATSPYGDRMITEGKVAVKSKFIAVAAIIDQVLRCDARPPGRKKKKYFCR